MAAIIPGSGSNFSRLWFRPHNSRTNGSPNAKRRANVNSSARYPYKSSCFWTNAGADRIPYPYPYSGARV
ncbi:MAG: hypothetical protein O2860_04560 [Chloroflexi bacterium]|nr:hypothetical protein [Chloroflexota bacterium]